MNLNSATYAQFSRKMEQSLLVMHLHWTTVLVQWFWWVLKKQLHLVALHLHVFAVLLTLQHFQSISQSHQHLLFQRLLNGLVSPRTMWVQKKNFWKFFGNFFFFEKFIWKIFLDWPMGSQRSLFRCCHCKSTSFGCWSRKSESKWWRCFYWSSNRNVWCSYRRSFGSSPQTRSTWMCLHL